MSSRIPFFNDTTISEDSRSTVHISVIQCDDDSSACHYEQPSESDYESDSSYDEEDKNIANLSPSQRLKIISTDLQETDNLSCDDAHSSYNESENKIFYSNNNKIHCTEQPELFNRSNGIQSELKCRLRIISDCDKKDVFCISPTDNDNFDNDYYTEEETSFDEYKGQLRIIMCDY